MIKPTYHTVRCPTSIDSEESTASKKSRRSDGTMKRDAVMVCHAGPASVMSP